MYVIFNRKTGELVQTHIEPEEVRTPREELLSMVDPIHEQSELDVVLVDPESISVNTSYRIEIETGKLIAIGQSETAGFGSGTARQFDPEAITAPVRTVYQRGPSASSQQG
jgi:hypothetical protein